MFEDDGMSVKIAAMEKWQYMLVEKEQCCANVYY